MLSRTLLRLPPPACSVLLWHRSDNLSFCLVLASSEQAPIAVGDAVECKIKGVLQVVDDVRGPLTRKVRAGARQAPPEVTGPARAMHA